MAEDLERRSLLPYVGSRALAAMGNVRVTMLVTSGVLTAGTLAAFMATGDRLVLLMGLFWPLLYPFLHALGLALYARVMPLMIERMVSQWESRLRESLEGGQLDVREPSLGLGDRVVVWHGRRRKGLHAGVVLERDDDGDYRVRLASGHIGWFTPDAVMERKEAERLAAVLAERIEEVPPELGILRDR